jgi:hypothetical protein
MNFSPPRKIKQTFELGIFARHGAPPSLTTTNDELVKKIRAAIASSRDAMRDAANDLHTLLCQGMTQREIADAVGKSVGWVNAMHMWQIGGCKGDSPFGPTTKRGRVQHAEQQRKKVSTKRNSVLSLAAPAPKPELVRPILEAEILEAVPTPTLEPEQATTELKPSRALGEFKFACEKYLPAMTNDERVTAMQFVAEIARKISAKAA